MNAGWIVATHDDAPLDVRLVSNTQKIVRRFGNGNVEVRRNVEDVCDARRNVRLLSIHINTVFFVVKGVLFALFAQNKPNFFGGVLQKVFRQANVKRVSLAFLSFLRNLLFFPIDVYKGLSDVRLPFENLPFVLAFYAAAAAAIIRRTAAARTFLFNLLDRFDNFCWFCFDALFTVADSAA